MCLGSNKILFKKTNGGLDSACRLSSAEPSRIHPQAKARQLLIRARPCSIVLVIKLLSLPVKFTLWYSHL